MEPMLTYLVLILLLPLAAFLIQIVVGRHLPSGGDWVSILAVAASFMLSVVLFARTLGAYDPDLSRYFEIPWIQLHTIEFSMGILFDNLTAVMLMIVTGVSLLVHIYSRGYMEDDPGYHRFYAFLSLFTFSMLGIVLTDNLFGLFIFWELVGLSSYLLIGFWYRKSEAANAAKKAFLTTRVGDLGMFLGIMMLVWYLLDAGMTEPLHYATIFEAVDTGILSGTLLTGISIALFFGAVGKSAQLPLQVWLPDAMEGPTPVSALIHAATMVAAGVYMVARLTPFFSPDALIFIGYIGAFTALVAASIALVKHDIKKILAYSTVSQLGFMFLALGLGGYAAGVLHLSTHAIFKALLFLGAGSVIHAVHSQDIRDMGGLWKKMPITFITFAVATLAIIGIPFFSGFYSKEKVLVSALLFGQEHADTVYPYFHMLPYIIGLVAAGFTAFYMSRLFLRTFFGEPGDRERVGHAHESPASMWVPMAVLGIFCFAFFFQAGPMDADRWAGAPFTDADKGWFEEIIYNPAPIVEYTAEQYYAAERFTTVLALSIAALGVFLAASFYAGLAWVIGLTAALAVIVLFVYWWLPLFVLAAGGLVYLLHGTITAKTFTDRFPNLRKLLAAKYYFDELYRDAFVQPTLALTEKSAWTDDNLIDGVVNASAVVVKINAFISGAVDNVIVDGLVNGIANRTRRWGDRVRKLQSGEVQWYLSLIVLGFGLLLLATVLFW